jgi:hypothetical protein
MDFLARLLFGTRQHELGAVVFVAVLALGGLATLPCEFAFGYVQGYANYAAGGHVLKKVGVWSDVDRAYAALLEQRYGVELRAVGGCMASDAMRARVEGHNAAIGALLEHEYGRGALDATRDDAKRVCGIDPDAPGCGMP